MQSCAQGKVLQKLSVALRKAGMPSLQESTALGALWCCCWNSITLTRQVKFGNCFPELQVHNTMN